MGSRSGRRGRQPQGLDSFTHASPNRVVCGEVGLWVEKGSNGGGFGLMGFPWQEEGELCLNSAQCRSKCCHRDTGLSLARCAPKARESSECSAFVSAECRGGVVAGRTAPRRRALEAWGAGGGNQGGGSVWTRNVEMRGRSAGFKALSHPIPSLDPHHGPVRWVGQPSVIPVSCMGS